MSLVDDAANSMIANLATNTGKTLEEWINIVGAENFEKHGHIVKWLKSQHSMTHGYANLIAHKTLASDAASHNEDDLISAQYAKKPALKPIYDILVDSINQFGNDIQWVPKKAYVSVRRRTQFAIIYPSTASRLDLGLKLKDASTTPPLEIAGSWNTMVTHRIRISSVKEVDDGVIRALQQAYKNAL